VLTGSQAVISCDFTGLLSKLDSVAWKKPGGEAITTSMTDYAVVEGNYNLATKTQTSTLTVKNGVNNADAEYKCVAIRSGQSREQPVQLKIFCECRVVLIIYTNSSTGDSRYSLC
jgi:hypothetical protein